MAVGNNAYIEEAYEEVIRLSNSEMKRLEYETREKALKDKVSFLSGARREGIKEGIKEGRRSLIEGALKAGSSPEEIIRVLGITPEEVLGVQKNNLPHDLRSDS